MPQDNSPRPVSPELKRLQEPAQNSIRTLLRIAGPVIFLAGLVCTIIGTISFFVSFGSFGMPHYFWLAFIGMPLMFVGGVLCQFGFFGAVARFIAGESAPVAAGTPSITWPRKPRAGWRRSRKPPPRVSSKKLTRVMRNPARERIDL
jgi:hypothetical protein